MIAPTAALEFWPRSSFFARSRSPRVMVGPRSARRRFRAARSCSCLRYPTQRGGHWCSPCPRKAAISIPTTSFPMSVRTCMCLPRCGAWRVGPDQSFSYLAAARPAVAFLIDVRRDNLLQHLLLRSLFALSSNRAEYLARLHGRALPENERVWDDLALETILDRVDSLPADPAAVRSTRRGDSRSLARAAPSIERLRPRHDRPLSSGIRRAGDRPALPHLWPCAAALLPELPRTPARNRRSGSPRAVSS